MGISKVWVKFDGFEKIFFCFYIVLEFVECYSKIIIGLKVFWIDLDGLFIVRDGLIIIFLFFERVSKIVMSSANSGFILRAYRIIFWASSYC